MHRRRELEQAGTACRKTLEKDHEAMPTINRESSTLLVVDFQSKLMPAIDDGMSVLANARRLLNAAEMLQVPILFTEQNANGLGSTVPELRSDTGRLLHKMTFDACRTAGFLEAIANRHDLIVSGCEAHVCVLQTVMGLLRAGRRVYVVRDAVGSRRPEGKEAAIRRMERNGAEIVTTEMVVFEWLETAEHPRLRDMIALIK
jgi:nicotinamidase-related amidase